MKYYPYERVLREMVEDHQVAIDRAQASTVKGKLGRLDDDGVWVKEDNADLHPDASKETYVAYRDIRGVATSEWDYSKIQK